MKILITGADGFIGKNLIEHLRCKGYGDILPVESGTPQPLLQKYAGECGFVFHLAGVNRPRDPEEFLRGNSGFTTTLLDCLRRCGSKAPVAFASSVQAEQPNEYGLSKKAAEGLLEGYADERRVPVYIYRLTNVFGKWCRPNYNSAVATFCHNIARGMPITVDDAQKELNLVYIDDVAGEFIRALEGKPDNHGRYCHAGPVYTVSLGRIEGLLRGFAESRKSLEAPDMSDAFVKKLYAAYLSYLPSEGFGYALTAHSDARGSFTEFIRTPDRGQVSVNVSRPGIVKGNHYHHTKNEKFLVVSGEGVIRLRRVDSDVIAEYVVGGKAPRVVEIPPGYVHDIRNTGAADMVTLMWASEAFDPDNHDTWPMEVDI